MSKSLLVGHMTCPLCGRRCEVKQIQTRGNRLFLACVKPCNTCIRLDAAETQTRIWNEAEFMLGVVVKKPSNVTETEAVEGEVIEADAPQVERVAEQLPPPDDDPAGDSDFDPNQADDEPEPEPEKSAGKAGVVALGVMGVAAIIGGLMS